MKSLQELRKKLKKPKQPTPQNQQLAKEQKPIVQNEDLQDNERRQNPLEVLSNEVKSVISNQQSVSNVQKPNTTQIIENQEQKHEKAVQVVNQFQQAEPSVRNDSQIINVEVQDQVDEEKNQIRQNLQEVDIAANYQELDKNSIDQQEKLVQQLARPSGDIQNNQPQEQIFQKQKQNTPQDNDQIKQNVVHIEEEKRQIVTQQVKNPVNEEIQQSIKEVPKQGLSKIQMMREKMRLKKLLSASSKSIPQNFTNQVPVQQKNEKQSIEKEQHQTPKEMEIEIEQSNIEPKDQNKQSFEVIQAEQNHQIERNAIEQQNQKQKSSSQVNQTQPKPQAELKPVQKPKPKVIKKAKPVQQYKPESTLFHKLHHLRQSMAINVLPCQKSKQQLNPQYIKSFIKQLQTFKKNLQQWQTVSLNQ